MQPSPTSRRQIHSTGVSDVAVNIHLTRHRQATSIARRKTLITEDEQPLWMKELAMRKKGPQGDHLPTYAPARTDPPRERKSAAIPARKRDSLIGNRRSAQAGDSSSSATLRPSVSTINSERIVLNSENDLEAEAVREGDRGDPIYDALFAESPGYQSVRWRCKCWA